MLETKLEYYYWQSITMRLVEALFEIAEEWGPLKYNNKGHLTKIRFVTETHGSFKESTNFISNDNKVGWVKIVIFWIF